MLDEAGFLGRMADRIESHHVVLDFGAGRGDLVGSPLVDQRLVDFRGRCRHIDGCDIDPAVLDNPALDRAVVIDAGPLPYPDNRFDIIVARSVFEHLEDPAWAGRELLRVLKPDGSLYAVTPNRWGYVALAARLTPSRLQAAILRRVQPKREEACFPTRYRLNTAKAARAHFRGAHVSSAFAFGPPGYGPVAFMTLLHRLLPAWLAPQIHFEIRKPSSIL